MLIDTGTRESAGTLLEFLQEQGVTSLDVLLLTHPDKDHIGGVPDLLDAVTPAQIFQADFEKDSDSCRRYTEALAAQGLTPVRLRETVELTLGGAQASLIPGNAAAYTQSNEYSILTEVSFGVHRFLFMGDAEKDRLEEYLNTKPEHVDFLKVPHHGRSEKNSHLFLQAVTPDHAVITCSDSAPPDGGVLDALQAVGASVWLTSKGTVTAVSDGQTLSVQQKESF